MKAEQIIPPNWKSSITANAQTLRARLNCEAQATTTLSNAWDDAGKTGHLTGANETRAFLLRQAIITTEAVRTIYPKAVKNRHEKKVSDALADLGNL